MASTHDGRRHKHGHSHSLSNTYQLPPSTPAFSGSDNARGIRKAASNGFLFTHTETSRDTTPLSSPTLPSDSHSFEQNVHNFERNRTTHAHSSHSHSHSHHDFGSPMKSGRLRGESDLGRPPHTLPAGSAKWHTYSGPLTGLLLPTSFILGSAASCLFMETASHHTHFPLLRPHTQLGAVKQSGESFEGIEGQTLDLEGTVSNHSSPALFALLLTSTTLLLTGLAGKFGLVQNGLKPPPFQSSLSKIDGLLTIRSAQKLLSWTCALALPFYASILLGGCRIGMLLLLCVASGLGFDARQSTSFGQHLGPSIVILLSLISDLANWTLQESVFTVLSGYLALACAIVLLSHTFSTNRTDKTPKATSFVVQTLEDVDLALYGGVVMSAACALGVYLASTRLALTPVAIGCGILCILSTTATLLYANPALLRSDKAPGLAVGLLFTASTSFLFSPDIWLGTACNAVLAVMSFFSVTLGTRPVEHSHDHPGHHHHPTPTEKHSFLTKFLLSSCEPGSLLHGILSEKDSRRIAYFTTLNFSFMFIQGIYGYLSGSLGLLSDTVHMFFDCLGLIVGLGAAVASKWPTSAERPYGWGKLNTLAGFGNGIFLMLVSVEFVWEAIEGIVEAKELRHVKELMVVSVLGFLVNMVGLFAFGHAHAGHDHGHSHGNADAHSHTHSHGHESHQHDHKHDHSHDHGHANGHANGHVHGNEHEHSHEHKAHDHSGHSHDNENMHGIFLHVAADAGGSLAVIISTGLTLWRPWYLWDPIATIIIAVLIFAMAIPLVTSSGQKLLLVIPDKLEYTVKVTLQELGELRGVVGYAVPRFWIDDKDDSGDSHGHHHHGHDHGPTNVKIMGVIHVIAAHSADVDDVRERVSAFLRDRHMDVVVQMEKESGGPCWCRDASVSL